MTKKNKTPFGIFTESVGLYFSNFLSFLKYMSFPVLGQVLGLVIILTCTYFYSINIPVLLLKYPVLNNFNMLVLMSVVVSLPGMVIFLKAFWEYLVAYGAINSMLENMLKSGRVYDFDAHTELIKRRTPAFVGLWLIIGVFSLLAICPLLWVPAGVIGVFLVLVFQVFTFEPEQSPFGCIRKSMQLVKGHFASTFMLLALVGLLTYTFIPKPVNMFFDWIGVTKFLSGLALPLINQLPVSEFNGFLAKYYLPAIEAEKVAVSVVTSLVAQVLIQFTLPLRSILWGMWYRELNGSLPETKKPKKTGKSKKPSEKLMEETHKKFGTKKLDRNILRRAMEKDDEE